MRRSVAVLAAIVWCVVSVPAYAYENGDFQIWHTEGQELKLAPGAKVTMEEEFRYGGNASELYYQHYEWGAVFGFDKRLDIGINYRQIYDLRNNKWMEENRPHVNATLKLDLWKFKFEDRNRIEYRHFRYRDDFIRYRNRFLLKLPLSVAALAVAPYVSDEIFISSNATGFMENRLHAGVEVELVKQVKCEAYYMFRSIKISGDKWTNNNVLGMKLKIAF